jgi:phage terminase large subunit
MLDDATIESTPRMPNEDLGPDDAIEDGSELVFEIPKKMVKFFVPGPRYRVVHGGRGSVKSWTIARALIVLAYKKKLRILCAREYMKSIRESVHFLLKSQIERMGLSEEFTVRDTEIICNVTGSQFIFAGLHHNVASLKSIEAVDICWIEEGETTSQASWDTLDPTIRKPGSEIWISFNPIQETDPVFQMFALPHKRLPGAVVLQVGWDDNPWLPRVLRQQAEYMREHDPERYEHIWGGKTWFKNDAQVLNGKWGVKEFDIAGHFSGGPYFGADWGFSQDPTALTKSFVEVLNPEDVGKTFTTSSGDEAYVALRRNLYIAEEAFALGCETRDLPAMFDTVSDVRKYIIKADNARPETISHMKSENFMIEACEKWPGCVEDGVTYLRGFEHIYIHPSCTHMYEEARLWSHQVDRLTSAVSRKLKPGYEHGWDSVRYAHETLITRTPTMFDV